MMTRSTGEITAHIPRHGICRKWMPSLCLESSFRVSFLSLSLSLSLPLAYSLPCEFRSLMCPCLHRVCVCAYVPVCTNSFTPSVCVFVIISVDMMLRVSPCGPVLCVSQPNPACSLTVRRRTAGLSDRDPASAQAAASETTPESQEQVMISCSSRCLDTCLCPVCVSITSPETHSLNPLFRP